MSQTINLPNINDPNMDQSIVRELLFSSFWIVQHILIFWSLIYVDSYLLKLFIGIYLALSTIQGVLIVHDCIHFAAFKDKRFNIFFGRVIGAILLFPFHFFQNEHLLHHKNAGLGENDPEILHLTKSEAKCKFFGEVFVWLFAHPLKALIATPIGQTVHLVQWFINLYKYKNSKDIKLLKKVILDYFLIALIWIPAGIYLFQNHELISQLIFGILIPLFLGLVIVFYLAYPLHALMTGERLKDIPAKHRVFYISRTFDSNKFIRMIIFNLNYHIEHHLYPTISRWHLGNVAIEIRPTIIRYAKQNTLPLAIHPSYLHWYAEFNKINTAYNPIERREDWKSFNKNFEFVAFE